MNRYKLRYKSGYNDLPEEIVADGHQRLGSSTVFYREAEDGIGMSTHLHNIATNVIVHIELVEEDVDH